MAASGAGGANGAGELTFYPQAGILWRDLYPNNFVDLDPGPGLRDYACGAQTYDGHTGTDSDLRSFREMDIGVPVFAALDGRVISVQDGEFDRNHGQTSARFDNHVVLEHGRGRFTIYGHLRKGIELRRNDRVVAGQQLGWTASSGNSSWPHLHFTSQVEGQVDEPFAGPCNDGPSGYAEQVHDPDRAVPPRSRAQHEADDREARSSVRPGGAHRNARARHAGRVHPGRAGRGAGARRRASAHPLHPTERLGGVGDEDDRSNCSRPWPLVVRAPCRVRPRRAVAGRGRPRRQDALADAPVDVVSAKRDVRNRPPNAITAELVPAKPTARDVVQCRVSTSLVTEDPDLDIVRYRYRWTVDGKLVRTVQSAALSDVLRKGRAGAGKTVRCVVTPSDGRLVGPPASTG